MATVNPELVHLASYLEQGAEPLNFANLPNFNHYSENLGIALHAFKPELVLTSKEINQRIIRDFKKTKETKTSNHTEPGPEQVDHTLPTIIFQDTPDKEDDESLSPQLSQLESVLQLKVGALPCPTDELQTFMYAVTVALYPEIISYQLPERRRCFKQIRSRMAFDLDDRKLFTKFGYRGVFRKTVAQDLLFAEKPIRSAWFRRYLADYFDMNIVVVYENIVVTFAPLKFRTSLICYYDHSGLQILTHGNGACCFDYNVVERLLQTGRPVIDQLQIVGKYKLKELQQLATGLRIPITCKGNNANVKNIVKQALYQDVSNSLSWLE